MAVAARRALVRDARPRRARGAVRRAHAVPARPRPDRPLQAVPAPEGKDAGLHRPGGRPLPHADDAHARDDRDLARRRPRAAAERGSRRGDRPRARHRPHAVRSRGRGGARRGAARRFRPRFRHNEQSWRIARAAEPHTRGLQRDPHAHGDARAGDAGGEDRPASSTGSPTSTTTSTTRSATGSSPRASCRATRSTLLGATGSERIDALVHDIVETSEREGDIAPERRDRRGDALAARVHVRRVYLGPHVEPEHRRAREVVRRSSSGSSPNPSPAAGRGRARRPDHRLRRRDDRSLRARVRGGAR